MSKIGKTKLPRIVIAGDGIVRWDEASQASKYLLQMKVSGDTDPRFRIRADGQIEWGSGSAAPDVALYRLRQNHLQVKNHFTVYRAVLGVECSSVAVEAFFVWINGEPVGRFYIYGNGKIWFGSGTGAMDTNLYRLGASLLRTDDKFLAAAGIGVGNSAAGTTLGSVIKKIEVFDATGASLGFLPVYDAIT